MDCLIQVRFSPSYIIESEPLRLRCFLTPFARFDRLLFEAPLCCCALLASTVCDAQCIWSYISGCKRLDVNAGIYVVPRFRCSFVDGICSATNNGTQGGTSCWVLRFVKAYAWRVVLPIMEIL